MKIEELKEKLFKKVEKELDDFKEDLKQKAPEEIIENAYKLTAMEGIIGELKERSFDIDEIKALLKEDNVLNKMYSNYERRDGSMLDSLVDITRDILEDIDKEFTKNKQKVR